MPTQFITNPRRSPDNRDYKFYSTYVNEAGERKITGGWEYREDAADAVREMVETCQNIGWPAESFKVYSRAFLVRSGIDPKVGVHWDNPPQGKRSNPRRNPDAVTLRVPASAHDEFWYLAVETYQPRGENDPFYSPERVAFVRAARGAEKRGQSYIYTLAPLAMAYLPKMVSDGIELAQNRQYGETDPGERARNRRLIKSLAAVLAEARAGGTKPKVRPATAKPATPSLDTLMDVLDIVPDRAKRLKAMMGGFASVGDVLNTANGYMSGYGVAYAPSTQDAAKGRNGLSYVNMGNTYSATLVYDHDKGRYLVSSWGDIVEADGRLPKTRRRFA